jgi:hypothetical protein
MNWLDRLMDRLTQKGTKVVAAGHAPGDTEPETGSGELSEELQADYGADSAAAEPPPRGDTTAG